MSLIERVVAAAAAIAAFATSGLAAAQDWSEAPVYGALNLREGFRPDPVNVNVLAGGRLDAAQTISSSCRGFVANAPTVRLIYDYDEDRSLPLVISVNSSANTTLVVNGPEGDWYCDDDGGETGLNPSLYFASPQAGQYTIWVGALSNAPNQRAVLSVSAQYSH